MSLFKYMFDHDYLQRADIEALRSRARKNERRERVDRRKAQDRLEQLEDEVAELTLLSQALLLVLRESGALDQAKLQRALEEIDAADGVIDGKVTRPEDRPRPPRETPSSPTRRKRHT